MWRLTSEIIAYFPIGTKKVYLSAVEKKQYQSEVLKLIGNEVCEEVRLYENSFKLMIGENLSIYAKCSEFPVDDWYEIPNFHLPELSKIIAQVDIGHGIINGEYEACFSDNQLGKVSFVCPEMLEYKSYFEEMKRRINCEMCKKTKKWVPGHRYDTITSSVYYLCPVLSRRKDELNSEFKSSESDMSEVFLYVESLNDDEKKISDILRGRGMGEIKIGYTKSSMVDSGVALEDDFSGDIQDYWKDIFKNTSGENLKSVLDIFSIISPGRSLLSDRIPVLELSDIIKNHIFTTIIDSWDIDHYRADLYIGNKNSDEENIRNLSKLFIATQIKDGNFLKNLYYPELFKNIGLNLLGLATEVFHEWQGTKLDGDFDTYLKYHDYYANQNRIKLENNTSKQRIKSTDYKLEVVTLKDLYGEGELRDTIKAVIENARDNYGLGISEYTAVNIGTKKDPKEYIISKVTLDDILKFKKGISGMSENLKKEIMLSHFVWASVTFDKEGEIN
ncbi:MAG: hypothetical protein J6I84_02495 [Bacilli bacterium]|nr:hypothetical protein [Bacilli bacterium]